MIHLSFSLLNFLAIPEGQGCFFDCFNPEKKWKSAFFSCWPFCQPLSQTSLPHSQRVKRKPMIEKEQQLYTSWENCQSLLVSDLLSWQYVQPLCLWNLYLNHSSRLTVFWIFLNKFKCTLYVGYYPYCRPKLLGESLSSVFCRWESKLKKKQKKR